LAQQFLNIGKPFLFEGIGSLVKIRSGDYEFTAGQFMSDKVKEYSLKEISATSTTEDSFTDYQNVFKPRKTKSRWKSPVMAFLLVLGLGLAIWAGYTISKKRTVSKEEAPVAKNDETVLVPVEQKPEKKDTLLKQEPLTATITTNTTVTKPVPPPAGNYKFILETAGTKRAFERFYQLKSYFWNIQMETKDSQQYKLYMILPATASDTTRMVDSISVVYGKRAYVERNN
jgi:hypothetical protein